MHKSKKSVSARMARLAGSSLIVLSGALAAEAVTTSAAPAITDITGTASLCRFSFNYTVTGVTDNGGGLDNYGHVLRYPNSSGANAATITNPRSIPVGTTESRSGIFNFPGSFDVAVTATVPAQLFVADDTGTVDAVGATVSRNNLIAAGGACAGLVANVAPVADAGAPTSVPGGSVGSLNAGGSRDDDGDALTYAWSQLSGPSVTLSDPAAIAPSFTAPAFAVTEQVLTFQVDITDGVDTATDTVAITVPANQPPVVDAGANATILAGELVNLNGSASFDPDGFGLSYIWEQTSGPSVEISDATSVLTNFTAPAALPTDQVFTFQLTVNDGTASETDSVVFSLLGVNSIPVADAGANFNAPAGTLVTLDGTSSSDSDGDALTYAWRQVSGTPVTLSDATLANPTFTAPPVTTNEDLIFELIVNDGTDDSLPVLVTVTVETAGAIRIIQRVSGVDTQVDFTSDLGALTGSISTSNGTGELVALNVPAGAYSVTASDLSSLGYALTDLSCSDADSVVDLASRTINIELSPAEDLTCTYTSTNTREAATTTIQNFLTGRNGLLLANQPDIHRRVARLEDRPVDAGNVSVYGFNVPGTSAMPMQLSLHPNHGRLSTNSSQMRAALSPANGANVERSALPFEMWAEFNYGSTEFDDQEYDYQIAYIGGDYLVSDTLLLGVMGQYDGLDHRGAVTAGSAEGDGWMIGPYATARLSPNLFGDVRASWGQSDNSVSPLGTFIDDFETSRSLYAASLTGVFGIGEKTQLRPEFSLRYISEEQKAYRDSLGVEIPSQTVDQGDVSFSPRLDHTFQMEDGWRLKPYLSVEGIYTFGAADEAVLEDAVRARFELGGELFQHGGFGISISANYDGLGAAGYTSSGITISLIRGF